jgi:hypothetical protein
MITGVVNALLERYGQSVEVVREETAISARAFLRPILTKREHEHQLLPTPLGLCREDQFLYLGQEKLTAGQDRVLWQGQSFSVQSAEAIYAGGELTHYRAILAPGEKEET